MSKSVEDRCAERKMKLEQLQKAKKNKKQAHETEPEPELKPEPEQSTILEEDEYSGYTYSYGESDSDEIYIKPKNKPVEAVKNVQPEKSVEGLQSEVDQLKRSMKGRRKTNKTIVQIINPTPTETAPSVPVETEHQKLMKKYAFLKF